MSGSGCLFCADNAGLIRIVPRTEFIMDFFRDFATSLFFVWV